MKKDNIKGILEQSYAIGRQKKPELIFRFKVRARVVADAVQHYLDKLKQINILDFGSAEGLTLLELNSLLPNSTFTGIEYSKELIQLAPKLPSNIKLIQGDVTNLSHEIKKHVYGVVSALALLEHLSNPIEAVKEATTVLRPGGLFIATCPNPFWDNVSTWLGLLPDKQHAVDMNKVKLIEMVKKAGLKVITYKRFMWAPFSVLPYLKINISPSLSLKLDRIVRALKIFNMFFVNQIIIARKPINKNI